MSRGANHFKIGVFVLTALIIGAAALVVLGAGVFFERKVIVETYFEESIQGLDIGSPLKFRGFRVGRVEEIDMVGKAYLTDRRYIMIRSSIPLNTFRMKGRAVSESAMQKEIQKGLRSRLGFQGLTGTAHVEMDYVDPERYSLLEIDWVPEHLYIPAVPSTITRLTVAVDRIMRRLEKVNMEKFAQTIQTTFSTITEALEATNIKGLVTQAETLISEVRETNRRLSDALEGLNLKPILRDASATVSSARRLVEDAEKPFSVLISSLEETSLHLQGFTKKLDGLSGELPGSLTHLKKTLRGLEYLVRSQQQSIEETLENFRVFSRDLRDLGEDAKRYPAQVLFGGPPDKEETGRR